MRKILLGLVASAAIATPLARRHAGPRRHHHIHRPRLRAGHRGSRSRRGQTHIEYKYKPAVGTGHIKWSTEDCRP